MCHSTGKAGGVLTNKTLAPPSNIKESELLNLAINTLLMILIITNFSGLVVVEDILQRFKEK